LSLRPSPLPAHRESLAAFVEEHKPLLRGWSHALGAGAAVVITAVLGRKTSGDAVKCISVLIFGVSMIGLYVGSAIYNLGTWRGRADRILQAIDHANIFVYIAGTYTPLCVLLLSGRLRVVMLAVIWSSAILGVVCSVVTLQLPRWITTGLYIMMGWSALLVLPSLARLLPLPAFGLLMTGGVLYTLGALIFMFRQPDPLPHIFGFHELFHLFVLAGSAAFVGVIWGWVVT
jgi:hemolysin III